MPSRLWSKFLVLLVSVAAIGLSGSFLLREFMVRDFRTHLRSEMEARTLWLVASLESSYATHHGWEAQDIIDTIVWAAMMGIDIRVQNSEHVLISDTEAAFHSLSPPVKARVLAFYRERQQSPAESYATFPLKLGGIPFGRLDARILPPKEEALFIRRSNRFLLLSVFLTGGMAIALSIAVSRKLTRPIGALTRAAARIAEGNLEARVDSSGRDELGALSRTFNEMARKLATQEKLRRKLTANMAHELRTPISAVRAEIEAMLDGLIPIEKAALQSLHAEVGRLQKILDAVEDLSQAEASSLHLEKQDLRIASFLGTIVERFRLEMANKGIALHLECPEDKLLSADPDKLSQILINLLSNASRATERGGTVRLLATDTGSAVEISCSDDGAGIDPADLPHVFERFYRGRQGGLGLGLTIVKELVEAHGGEITVQSKPGTGTRFILHFPK